MKELTFNEKVRVCQRLSKCSWCGEPIKIGSSTATWTDFLGSPCYIKMHMECKRQGWDHCAEEWDMYENPRGLKKECSETKESKRILQALNANNER